MTEALTGPDEIAVQRDLASPAFRLGVRGGRWRLERLAFPLVYFQVAAPPRDAGPARFLLRADCRDYPATAPTACLWDGRQDAPLSDALKPKGIGDCILLGFTTACGPCLYHPIDRMARPHWPDAHPDLVWRPGHDITHLLECVHGLLDDSGYRGSAAPEAAACLP